MHKLTHLNQKVNNINNKLMLSRKQNLKICSEVSGD